MSRRAGRTVSAASTLRDADADAYRVPIYTIMYTSEICWKKARNLSQDSYSTLTVSYHVRARAPQQRLSAPHLRSNTTLSFPALRVRQKHPELHVREP